MLTGCTGVAVLFPGCLDFLDFCFSKLLWDFWWSRSGVVMVSNLVKIVKVAGVRQSAGAYAPCTQESGEHLGCAGYFDSGIPRVFVLLTRSKLDENSK
jgi:hypothetical protein